MKWRQKVLIEWRGPKDAKETNWRLRLAEIKPVLLRLPFMIGAVVLFFWWLFKTLIPQFNFNWFEASASLLVVVLIIFGMGLLVGRIPQRYRMTDHGISWNSGSHARVVPWKQIQEVFLYQPPAEPPIPVLRLRLKANRWATLKLPLDDSSPRICEMIRERVPAFVIGEPPKIERPIVNLPTKSLALFLCLIGIYLFGLMKFLQDAPTISPKVIMPALSIILFLGPGTWGAAILAKFQWDQFRRGMFFGVFFNMLAFLVSMIMLAIRTTLSP